MTSVSLDRIASALGMTESKTPDTHIWATVSSINEDGSYQVRMNGAGASETTRAARLCNAYVGDRVLCVVSNGQATAIGRVGGERHDWVKPWTLIHSVTGTDSASIDLDGYEEVMVFADASAVGANYGIQSVVYKVSDIPTDSTYRVYVGGSYDAQSTAYGKEVYVYLTKTYFAGVNYRADSGTNVAANVNWKIYAR